MLGANLFTPPVILFYRIIPASGHALHGLFFQELYIGQVDFKFSAFSQSAFHFDFTVVQINNMFANAEPQATATFFP